MSGKSPQAEFSRRLSVLEDILDVSSDSPCGDHDAPCEGPCSTERCARSNNRLRDLGSLVATLIHEFRWYRAWAEELESAQVVPSGTVARVGLRVQRALLEEALQEAEASRKTVNGLSSLESSLDARIQQIHERIEQIDKKLNGAEA